MPERSRILQEANAPGKAWGYADVKTTCAQDSEPGSVKKTWKGLTETRRIVQPYRRRHMTLWNGTTRAGSHHMVSRCQPEA